jgi:hypothetical protein
VFETADGAVVVDDDGLAVELDEEVEQQVAEQDE